MTLDRFEYQCMVQDALRGVVRSALEHVEEHGLPGVHHFYITYNTRYRGVSLPQNLLDRYPDQITVVIQNDYRDLVVEEDRFSVTLRFGGLPQRIIVPFKALSVFYDPSEEFALQFEPETESMKPTLLDGGLLDEETPAGSLHLPVRAVLDAADRMHAAKEAQALEEGEGEQGEATPDGVTSGDETAPHEAKADEAPSSKRRPGPVAAIQPEQSPLSESLESEALESVDESPVPEAEDSDDGDEVEEPAGKTHGNVVSIDAFRRK